MKDTPLRDELNRRIAHLNYAEALLLMGYIKPQKKHRERLRNVLNSPFLGLENGAFDMKFSDQEFALKLSDVLGVDSTQARQQLDAINEDRLAHNRAFKPYISIHTGFKRADRPGMPLFVLATLLHRCYLYFEPFFWRLPLHEQVAEARETAQQHYQAMSGKLEFWGDIQHYRFFYAEGQSILLDTQGHPVDD